MREPPAVTRLRRKYRVVAPELDEAINSLPPEDRDAVLLRFFERQDFKAIGEAIGATENDVQKQFLLEAIVLSIIGGTTGIIFGAGVSLLISRALQWNILISPTAIVAAVVFSTAVGIFFGFYPARKAARLDPIEALRFE